MYKKVIQKGLILLLIILLGLLIYLIKLSYKENELISTGSTTTKIETTSSTTTTTVTTTTTSTTTTTTKAIEFSDSIYAPYHIENYDNYSIDNIADADIQRVFTEKGAVVCGDSMAEGLTAYNRDEILCPLLQYRMDNNLTTFFTSNLNMKELECHLSNSKNGVDEVKARRIISRIEQLTVNLQMISKNLRK